MLKLSQLESNLLMFCKNHYNDGEHDDFWKSLSAVYCQTQLMEYNILGVYHMIRRLWEKYFVERIKLSDNIESTVDRFLSQYEEDSVPWSLSNIFPQIFNKKDSFTAEDVIKAKIKTMIGQLSISEIKYFEYLPLEKEWCGLKLIHPEYFTDKKTLASAE